MIKLLAALRWFPLNAYGPCVGLTLWRWGRLKIELWVAPADYSPPEHIHQNSSSEFTIIYSKNRHIWRKTAWATVPHREVVRVVGKGDEYNATTPQCWGRWLSVRAGVPHKFEKGDSCMIWLCVERWKPGVKVTSVAEDFVLTGQ